MELTATYLHVLVALVYVALALLAPAMTFNTPTETWLARIGWASFFVGCAITSLYDMSNMLTNTPTDPESWVHGVALVMQAVGATVFLITAGPYLRYLPTLLKRTSDLAAQADRERDRKDA